MTKTDWQDVVRTVSDEVSEILGIKKKYFNAFGTCNYIKIEQYNDAYKYNLYIYIYTYIYSIYTIDMCSAGNHQTM